MLTIKLPELNKASKFELDEILGIFLGGGVGLDPTTHESKLGQEENIELQF